MKKILLMNKYRTIEILVPLFGKIRWKKIKPKEIRGENINLVFVDEIKEVRVK